MVQGAVVAVTRSEASQTRETRTVRWPHSFRRTALIGLPLFAILVLYTFTAQAAILPEDRADIMYHGYDGGGLEVNGPSILVRKGFKDKVSVWANYYVDMITSASIDVVSTASEYEEERTETSVGVDYLYGKTSMGFSYTNSEESDYTADSMSFGISQDFFGDLSNIGISYSRGKDEVRRNGDDTFAEETERQGYRVDFSQIVTKNMIVSLNYEAITDEGFLNNPYRQVRFLDPGASRGYSYEAELYPRTRTSDAIAIRAMYYLPYRASLKAEFRTFSDSWGIKASNAEIAYTHPFDFGLTVEAKYRYYSQTAADFYSDLFSRSQEQNFLARDKELSTFATQTLGVSASYQFGMQRVPFFKKGEVNISADYIDFQFDDFRDVTATGFAPGAEPEYGFDSLVLRIFFSVWY